MPPLSVIFGLHAHEPVGQSVSQVDRTVDGDILPFLEAVSAIPAFKCAAHLSGSLLRLIEGRRADVMDMLKRLIGRGQLELLGGGFYEPILTTLTVADQTGQIRRFGDYLQRQFGVRPAGGWLPEQVWEPHLCKPLQEAGVKFVLMDDPHFAAAGVPADEVHGLFVTEESGHRLGVFPIDSGLKNLIPDKSPKETINYLENLSEEHPGTVVAFMGDGAVAARLIPALAREKFLAPVTPTEWAAGHAPRRLLYVPSASSAEMSEWILPPGLEDEYAGFKSQVVRHTRASAQRLFLRGGFWRAFLTKYAESNWMQKRVFAAATKMGPVLEKLGADREARAIRDLLDRAACHDAYWHGAGAGRGNGPAGGFYAPPIRAAVWRNLLEAETRFSKKMGLFPACFSDDIDCDGEPEWMVYTESWVIGFKPRLGGGMIEWSYRPALHNFQNTVTRRPERDHAQLERHPRLVYDRYRKASGLVYALDSGVRFEQFARQDLPEQAPAVGETQAKAEEKAESFSLKFRREAGPFVFEKHVVISKHESKLSLQVSVCASPGSAPWRLGLGFELFYARLEDLVVEGSLLEGSARSRSVSVTDRGGGTTVVMKFDREVEVWLAPVWTISKSMDGVQETFQGISVLFLGDDAGAGVKQELTMNVEVKSIAGTQA